MKATGIVRRIDDLGRVVIPKEIRRTMRIREGDPLEIFTNHDGEVIFKKYSPIGELNSIAAEYCEALHKCGGILAVICDRDAIIACSGLPKKDYVDLSLTPELEKLMEGRTLYRHSADSRQFIVHNAYIAAFMPIIANGDVIGGVASLKQDDSPVSESEVKLIQTAAGFLARQLEE